jgi:hypothetical protein
MVSWRTVLASGPKLTSEPARVIVLIMIIVVLIWAASAVLAATRTDKMHDPDELGLLQFRAGGSAAVAA